MEKVAASEGGVLSIVRAGDGTDTGPLYYNLSLRHYPSDPPQKPASSGFEMRRIYLHADGPRAGQPVEGPVSAGDVIQVRLTMVVPDRGEYIAVEDPIPSGFEPINTSFKTTSSQLDELTHSGRRSTGYWSWWYSFARFDHTEQRDDRVLLFADELRSGVYDHVYLVRATTPGTFQAPAARIEEMYNPHVFGRTEALTVEIK
jgi:hypothetical protein